MVPEQPSPPASAEPIVTPEPGQVTWQSFSSTLDRLDEAHWHLHEMSEKFHQAKGFRFALNSFLRALKEVPQIVTMEGQRVPTFKAWHKIHRETLQNDPLLQSLAKKRDVVVHKEVLWPESNTMVGITEGRGIKLGLGVPSDPVADSDELMRRALPFLAGFHMLDDDDESMPCVRRSWRLPDFPNEDLLDVGARAWHLTAQFVGQLIKDLAAADLNMSLSCLHSAEKIQWRLYDRPDLRRQWKLDPRRPEVEAKMRAEAREDRVDRKKTADGIKARKPQTAP